MKRSLLALVLVALAAPAVHGAAEAAQPFSEFFLDKTLRIDLYQTGDAAEETVTIHQVYEEGAWPESLAGPIPPLEYARYVYKL